MPKRPSIQARLRPRSAVEGRPGEWLWPGWIPLGRLTGLDGDPGVGKSTLLLDLAACLGRDGVMPDGAGGPAAASVILSAEDGDEDAIQPRLAAVDFLRDLLADGPLPTGVCHPRARIEGVARRTLQRALKQAGVRRRTAAGDDSLWELAPCDEGKT